MFRKSISRRDVLKSFALGVMAGPLTRSIPLEAASYAHRLIEAEKTQGRRYQPKFFSEDQYKTLEVLCEAIIPSDNDAGGAIEAGAPEFIDLLTSENPEFQLSLGGGLMWLDALCSDRFGHNYVHCSPDEQSQMVALLAYRRMGLTIRR